MGTTFWGQAIQKEIDNVRVAFKNISRMVDEMRNGWCLPGLQHIGFHMIFDIKMDVNFTRKSRLVAGGLTTDPQH